MTRVSTYLNFPGNTEQAFDFYRSVFGNDYSRPIMRFRDLASVPDQPPVNPTDQELVVHVELVILGGHVLMGTDAPESMGFQLIAGNNMHINLEPDTLAEAQSLFEKLSAGGTIAMPLQPMFWGGHFGSLTDQFGVHWMINCPVEV